MLASSETEQWLVVLRPDGYVESVEGGGPIAWLGHCLVEVADIPESLRDAARELMLGGDDTSLVRRRRVRWVQNARAVEAEILVFEGVPLRRVRTRVAELIMRTLEVFALQARSNDIDLTIEQSSDVPLLLTMDAEKIAWALATLVANALRFAQQRELKKGGHIGVSITWDEAEAELVLTVSDNGPGMSAHRARWLFDRDPATGKSAGLALLMVRDVLVAHRGSVAVTSGAGQGTTFTMRIPRTAH